jgi:SAM-dependent methyltransferase
MNIIPEEQHNIEIHQNLKYWQNKPVLQKIYQGFYAIIKSQIRFDIEGKIVELGSGIGNLKSAVPEAICTDLFKNPWIDQVENAYHLSFKDSEVSNLILFDVFHHLKYPGSAFNEFNRVLKKHGRIIIFEPTVSLTGLVAYGLLHHEPLALFKKITWLAPDGTNPADASYYAAQGNAWRILRKKNAEKYLTGWNIVRRRSFSSISYILSGGYSKPQLYPDGFFGFIAFTDRILKYCPPLFASRLLVTLEKK